MAKRVEKITLGVDIAKDDCAVHAWETDEPLALPNQRKAIANYLDSLQGPVRIALEPTSNYHRLWVELALARGFEVYLVNPRQLAHYREAVNQRNKTTPMTPGCWRVFSAMKRNNYAPISPRIRKLSICGPCSSAVLASSRHASS